MSTPSLQAQLNPQTQQQVFALLLAYYQSAGFPTTAWEQGESDLATNQAFATALSDLVTNLVPAIAGGALLDYAPTYPGWTGLTAQQFFGISGGNNPATYTQGNILATNTSNTSYAYSPTSQLIAIFGASQNRYFSQGSGTIPATASTTINQGGGIGLTDTTVTVTSTSGFPSSGTIKIDSEYISYSSITATAFNGLTRGVAGSSAASHANSAAVTGGLAIISVQAEFPGATYADPSNANPSNSIPTALSLVSPLPGVWINNPSATFSAVNHVGNGTGTITPSGAPAGSHTLQVVIASTGQAGGASVSYVLDSGQPINVGNVSSLSNVGGTGINVTLANGATNPSFIYQDSYTFTTPSAWITSQGANAESDQALALRCKNKWPTISNAPTQGYYQYLLTSNPTVGAQVTQAIVIPDQYVNNKVNLVVAGPGGVLPNATISTLQSWVTPRARGCDNPTVVSPTTLAITYAATIYCAAGQVQPALAAATVAWQLYTALAPINGTLKLSALEALVVPNPNTGQGGITGVTDIQNITINGAAQNLPLGGVGNYVLPAYPPSINLTFVGQ